MKLTKVVAIGLAALLLTAGAAAAMPGNAPVDAGANDSEQAPNHVDQTEDSDEATDESANATEIDDAPANESVANASDETDGVDNAERAPPAEQRSENAQGPPTDMPEQVPDFVTDVHDLINQHLFGDLDGNLGEQISDVTPSEESESTAEAES